MGSTNASGQKWRRLGGGNFCPRAVAVLRPAAGTALSSVKNF